MANKKKNSKKPLKKSEKVVEQIHGKEESDLDKAIKTSRGLDEILGMRQKNPFNAETEASFEESLKGQNLADLREIAVKAGIFPSGNATILRNKLRKGFHDFMKGKNGTKASVPITNNSTLPNSELQQKINDIWSGK